MQVIMRGVEVYDSDAIRRSRVETYVRPTPIGMLMAYERTIQQDVRASSDSYHAEDPEKPFHEFKSEHNRTRVRVRLRSPPESESYLIELTADIFPDHTELDPRVNVIIRQHGFKPKTPSQDS